MLGAVLQMCRNTSKDGNDAMSIYTPSETDSDYIRQAKLVQCADYSTGVLFSQGGFANLKFNYISLRNIVITGI